MSQSWPSVLLTDICNPKQWPTISQSDLTTTGYPVYGANGKIGCYSDFNHERPTLLVTCRGATCGSLNICEPFSYVTGNSMALDDLDESRVNQKYLYYALLFRGFKDSITGTAQPQITRQSLSPVSVPLPPLPEQKRIATILDKAYKLKIKRKDALAQLDSLINSIFFDLFGDLRNHIAVPLESLASDKRYALSSGPFGSSLTTEHYQAVENQPYLIAQPIAVIFSNSFLLLWVSVFRFSCSFSTQFTDDFGLLAAISSIR